MKLLLSRCAICDYWYAPFHGHCPHCGAMPFKTSARKVRYYTLRGMRLLELVRGVPRGFEQMINTNVTK